MKYIHREIREHIYRQKGLSEPVLLTPPKDFDAFCRSQWSKRFEDLMRNRLVMGGLRHGLMGSPGKPQYDRVSQIIRRARKYLKTGNDELLVDIANMALLEFEEGDHPKKHFQSEDDVDHTEVIG